MKLEYVPIEQAEASEWVDEFVRNDKDGNPVTKRTLNKKWYWVAADHSKCIQGGVALRTSYKHPDTGRWTSFTDKEPPTHFVTVDGSTAFPLID